MRTMSVWSLILATMLACGCAATGQDAAPAGGAPAASLDREKDLDTGWGPVTKEGEHSYRAAAAGKMVRITVPVWWGKAARPPEGRVDVFRVTYKDTATEPVVFYSHAGVVGYWGPSEVHRFGGLGDGAWKTADIPVSWDLVIRKNAPGDITEFFIKANKDLPVASIARMPAEKDAAERYFTETREWVARVQAEKRKTADLGPKQVPVLPAETEKTKAALVPFVRTYMVPILPNAAPQKGEIGVPIKLRMARNQYETAGFAVYANGKDLAGVTVYVGGLTGSDGKLACEIELRAAEYSVVSAGQKDGKPAYQMFPQRMWPAYPVDIPAGRSHAFWITVKTLGAKTQPGKYTGTVLIKGLSLPVETSYTTDLAPLPIEIEVLPVTLPTMQEAGLDLGPCIGGLCTLQELKTLAEFNHTGVDIWFGGSQPQMTVKDGKLTQDFYYLDNFMKYAAGTLGMTHIFWFLGGDPYGFPDTLNLERDLYRALEGDPNTGRRKFLDKTNAAPDKVLPELRPLYVEWVRQTAKHAKENGWPKTLIIHPFDEPAKWSQNQKWQNPYHAVIGAGQWIKPHFKDCCALIREGAKGFDNVLVGGDIHHAAPGLAFVNDIDVFCTNAIHEDAQLGDKVRAAKGAFWQYSGCNDQSPAHRPRFTFGWYFAAFDSRGSLIWAYNTMARFDTSEGKGWGFGWYTPFGTVQTPFMIGVREGFDDRRWIELYKKQGGDKAALDKILKDAIAKRSQAGRDTVTDFFAEIAGYEQMDEWRNSLIDAVLKKAK